MGFVQVLVLKFLLCIRVFGNESVEIFLPEISMGLIPGAGGTVSLPRRIGPQKTAYLAMSGKTLSLSDALAWV